MIALRKGSVMVEIPSARAVSRVSPGLAPVATRGPAPTRGVAELGRAIQGAGNALDDINMQNLSREADAQAKEIDAGVSDEIRDMLYNPQTGFTNLGGQNAVGSRQSVLDRLDGLASSSLSGLSPAVQDRLRSSLSSRIERAKSQVDRYTSGERDTWLTEASNARKLGALQDALVDFDRTPQSLFQIEAELRDQSEREGWSAEKLEYEITTGKSAVYASQIERVAATSPVTAMEYLVENRDSMLATDVARLEASLQPQVKEYLGRQLGREAFTNTTMQAGDALVSLEEAIGFKLPINSAYRSSEENARVGGAEKSPHMSGKAFDVDVSNMSEAERKALIVKARNAGFSGIGVYDNALHFDVAGDRSWGPSFRNASLPAWARSVVATPIGGSIGLRSLVDEGDPAIRAAAMSEFKLMDGIEKSEEQAVRAAAEQQAFALIESGQSVSDIPYEARAALGISAMSSLRTYEAKTRTGTASTDPAIYMMLRTLQNEDPEMFRSRNILAYADALSLTDMKMFIDQQRPGTPEPVAVSTLMTVARKQMVAGGLNPNAKPGTDAAKLVAQYQTDMVKWQDGFIAENGRQPSQIEIDRQATDLLLPVVINRPGFMSGVQRKDESSLLEGFDNSVVAGEFETELRSVDGIITVDGAELPANVVAEIIDSLITDGDTVSTEAIVDRFLGLRAEYEG